MMMKKDKMAASVEYVNANPQATAAGPHTAGAIGYVGLGFVEGVKALSIDGIAAHATDRRATAAIRSAGRCSSLPTVIPSSARWFTSSARFYLTEKGQEMVEAKGFVPLTNY